MHELWGTPIDQHKLHIKKWCCGHSWCCSPVESKSDDHGCLHARAGHAWFHFFMRPMASLTRHNALQFKMKWSWQQVPTNLYHKASKVGTKTGNQSLCYKTNVDMGNPWFGWSEAPMARHRSSPLLQEARV